MVNRSIREMLPKLFKRCYKLSLGSSMWLYSRAGFGFPKKRLVLGVMGIPNALMRQAVILQRFWEDNELQKLVTAV